MDEDIGKGGGLKSSGIAVEMDVIGHQCRVQDQRLAPGALSPASVEPLLSQNRPVNKTSISSLL